MRLIERNRQLDLLLDLLDQAARGRGHVAALTGEAGVGKTALAQALAGSRANGARVLRGACEDLSIADPLGPVQDLARGANWDLGDAIGRHERPLAVFSEALKHFDQVDVATLIVIEDLHWADDATLDFVRYLGRRIQGTHILLLVTARDDEAAGKARIRRVLGNVPPDDVVRIDVPPLSEAAVAGLARDAGMDGAALFRVTGGNAFFVTELLRAGRGREPPPSVRDAVLARADHLSKGARIVLDAVSIFPGSADIAALEALCGADFATGTDECVAIGILDTREDAYAFRHELARRAVEGVLSPVLRKRLNTLALDFLRVRNVPTAQLLHHARAAQASETVRELAPVAAQEAARVGAHREAAEHYAAALAHADSYPASMRADLYEQAAFEFQLTRRAEEAIRAQTAALNLHRIAGDRLREGDGLRRLSRISYFAGDRAAADVHARRSVDLLADLPGPELAMAWSTLSQLAMLARDNDNARLYGERAIALAEGLNHADIVSHALNNIGFSELWTNPDHGRRLLERSLEIALEEGYSDHAARAYVNRVCFEFEMLDQRRTRAALEAGIAYCLEHDVDYLRYYMQGWKAEQLMREGAWDAAAAEALGVIEGHDSLNISVYPALLVLARLGTRRGDPSAETVLADLLAFLDKGMELQRFAPYAAIIAERAWLGKADPQEACRLLQEVSEMAPDPAMIPEIHYWRRLLAPDRALPDTSGFPEPYRLLLSGDWQAAADAWAEIGAPFEQALALLEGSPSAQRRALASFEALGAKAVAEHVRDLLRQRGVPIVSQGPRGTTRSNPAGLTRRQMDVLRLLDQGQSNAAIAARLFVSSKTVDHHVSAILDKLNARSRSEAAAVARRSGLI